MLRAGGDAGVGVDGESETGEVRAHREQESDEALPVDAEEVSIATLRVVKGGDVDLLLLHKPVVAGHDAGDGGEEDGVAAHEGEESFGGGEDFPGHDDPAADDGGDDAAAEDVDPAWEEDG